MPPKVIAALTFLIAYVMLIRGRPHPPYVVWSGSILLLALKVITPAQALRSINLNVIGIFIGMMILSDLFIHSQVPAYLACVIVHPKRSIASAVLGVCILSGVVSRCRQRRDGAHDRSHRLEICGGSKPHRFLFLIGIAVAANLKEPRRWLELNLNPSCRKHDICGLLLMKGRAGIFFSVELAAITSFYVLYLVFRRYKGRCIAISGPSPRGATILMVLMMLTMAASSHHGESRVETP